MNSMSKLSETTSNWVAAVQGRSAVKAHKRTASPLGLETIPGTEYAVKKMIATGYTRPGWPIPVSAVALVRGDVVYLGFSRKGNPSGKPGTARFDMPDQPTVEELGSRLATSTDYAEYFRNDAHIVQTALEGLQTQRIVDRDERIEGYRTSGLGAN